MIIISPYSKALRNGKKNPKNYPYWEELIAYIKTKDCHVIQVGEKSEPELNGIDNIWTGMKLVNLAYEIKFRDDIKFIICVDNFMHHLAHYYNIKCGVLWGQSDPLLFGYKENINLLKDRKHLRSNQFDVWESTDYKEEAFMSAQEVFDHIKHLL